MRIGIIGCGNIAGTLASTMVKMGDGIQLVAAASRDIAKAEEFASRFGIEKAYGSYEELYQDEDIDLVYIAVPHSHHKKEMIDAINHGKAVLCEKAFCVNAAEAEEVFALAKEKRVFVAEAIWTRYMPSRKRIDEIISSGQIGRVVSISANLGYKIFQKQRISDPKLAGGALLDVGVYPLNFAMMFAHSDLASITGLANIKDGVDSRNSISLLFKDGSIASIYSDTEMISDRKGIIYGTEGTIVIENINNPEKLTVYNGDRNPVELSSETFEHEINGYEYEIRECAECLEKGLLEPPSMPWAETVRVLKVTDSLRSIWGIKLASEITV